MKRGLQQFTWCLQYGLLLIFAHLLKIIPLAMVFVIGQLLGLLCYFLFIRRRRIAAKNLLFMLDEKQTAKQRKKMVRAIFIRSGANMLSALKTAFMPTHRVRKHVVIKDIIKFKKIAQQQGTVVILPHMSNWELLPHIIDISEDLQIPQAAIYQPLKNPYCDQFIKKCRQKSGTKLFSRNDNLKTIINFLKEKKGILGVLSDQRLMTGKICLFFNRLTGITPLPILLKARSNANVIALSIKTLGIAKWQIAFHDSITANSSANTADVAALIEQAMRQSLVDCFLFQDRWKKYTSPAAVQGKYPCESALQYINKVKNPSYIGFYIDAITDEVAKIILASFYAIQHKRADLKFILLSPNQHHAKLFPEWHFFPQISTTTPAELKQYLTKISNHYYRVASIVLPDLTMVKTTQFLFDFYQYSMPDVITEDTIISLFDNKFKKL